MHNPLRLLSNDLDARSSQLSLPMKRKESELPDCHSRTHMRFTLLWVVPEHELGKVGEMQQSANAVLTGW